MTPITSDSRAASTVSLVTTEGCDKQVMQRRPAVHAGPSGQLAGMKATRLVLPGKMNSRPVHTPVVGDVPP